MKSSPFLLCVALILSWGGAPLRAQIPPPLRYVQRIGESLPLADQWTDETGRRIPLAAALSEGKPALVVFGYYKCAQLCSLVERGAVDSLRELAPTVGRDFSLIYLSIDPSDTAEASRQERAASVRAYGRGEGLTGWHYLTADAETIRRAAAAAGFQFRYDARAQQFAHPAGFLVVTSHGVISRYFLGVDFAPRAVAAALREAGQGKIGASVFDLVVECFQGGRGASRKERLIWDGLWIAVGLTVAGLGGGIGWMLWQERRERFHA
jgi:protein SCO1/2